MMITGTWIVGLRTGKVLWGMGWEWNFGDVVVWGKSTEMGWGREKFMGMEWRWGRQFI